MSLPTGTLTFLFTDIEGSTRLWEEHPEAMALALARHDTLLRQAIQENNGYVFKTVGDAFCAAFATSSEALNAALAAQLELLSQAWEQTGPLQVRMALHTGEAQEREGDYFGQTLNRVARLQGIGHGQQTLLSQTTYDLVRDNLPPKVTVQNLGLHRLKDLQRPEQVFQLDRAALPKEFLPLKSLNNPQLPNNLPQQLTSFIGREKEMEAVKMLLAKTRLLTLTGSGGCGKTRLALQVAAEVLETYAEAVWLVELAPLADPALLAQTVAQTLSLREEAGKPIVQTLTAALKDKRLLLVLDNCEHLLDACARLVDTLLRACPHLKILASSREGLNIAGEQTYRLPALSLPDARQVQTVESVSQYEAVRLFIERALAVHPHFVVTNATAPALAQLCVRLDGIPLALELAAARVRSLSVEEIHSKLDNLFRLLTGGSRTALPRQQTLRALIDWSYDLLTRQEKTLLCHLCVFAGGWTLAAAEAVGANEAIEEWEILDLLTSLGDKSLVVIEAEQNPTRYRLLETVRQYARDRLTERGESEAVRGRHQAFFLAFAEEAALHMADAQMAQWLHWLESEHDNLRAALQWGHTEATLASESATHPHPQENQEAALRIAGGLFNFWSVRGYYTEGRQWLATTLASPAAQAPTPFRVKALRAAGSLAHLQGDNVAARMLLEQSLALSEKLGDKQSTARCLGALGWLAQDQSNYAAAQALYERRLALERESGNKPGIASVLVSLGNAVLLQGDYLAARDYYEQSLALSKELGDNQNIACCLGNLGHIALVREDLPAAKALAEESLALDTELGNKTNIARSLSDLSDIAHQQGDLAAAEELLEQSLAVFRALGDKFGMARLLNSLGNIAFEQGDYERARSLQEQSLTLFREVGNKRGIAICLQAFGLLAATYEQSQRATLLWGAAEALREAINAPLSPPERESYEEQVAQIRAAMDANAFAEAWAQGRSISMEQAIAYALEAGSV